MHPSASTLIPGCRLIPGLMYIRTWVLLLVLVGFVLCMSGCGERQIIPDHEALRCAHDIFNQLDASKQSLVKDVTSPDAKAYPVTLWVDMSASMYGYLTEPDSRFRQVLKPLTSRLSANLEIKGIGKPRDGSSVTSKPEIRDLLNQANYDRKDSDFGPVIRRFASQPRRIHLMLTDSVEWRKETLEHYGDLARAANEALKPEGEFALLVFRGSYKGAYSSAILAGHPPPNAARTWYVVDYDTRGRPFTIWAFLPPGASIESIKKHLKSHNLEAGLKLNLHEGDILPRLAIKIPAQQGQRRGERLLRDAQLVHSPDLKSFLKANIVST